MNVSSQYHPAEAKFIEMVIIVSMFFCNAWRAAEAYLPEKLFGAIKLFFAKHRRFIMKAEPFFTVEFIGMAIVFNTALLHLQTLGEKSFITQDSLTTISFMLLGIFVAELYVKAADQGVKSYLSDFWGWIDVVVVLSGLIELFFYLMGIPISSALSVLRVLRLFKILGLVSWFRVTFDKLMVAVPEIQKALLLMAIPLYGFSIAYTQSFQKEIPELFGSVGISTWTLIKLSLFQDFPVIVDTVVAAKFYLGVGLCLASMLVITFVGLNLLIAVIVNAFGDDIKGVLDSIKDLLDSIPRSINEVFQVVTKIYAAVIRIEKRMNRNNDLEARYNDLEIRAETAEALVIELEGQLAITKGGG